MTETRTSKLDPDSPEVRRRAQRTAITRLLAIVVVGALLAALVNFTPIRDWLDPDVMAGVLEALGGFAVPIFILAFGVLLAAWLPGTVMTTIGAALFGTFAAIPINYAGSVLGAVFGFLFARLLGGSSLDQLLAGRFRLYEKYKSLIQRRGFESILMLRIIPTPYNAVSFLGGLSPISLTHFTLATAIGILPGSIAFTLLIGTILDSLREGDFSVLFSWRILAVLAIYAPVILFPRFARHARSTYGWFGGIDVLETAVQPTEPETPEDVDLASATKDTADQADT